ncbi:MAG TPA: PQQ-binding-like beta-propeller repeat protein [Lachnospiraceae bacterium]|nr:PQQ-binding-like beta-propeller repeat protein [Lachnospiraceae bacterium]
MKYSIDRVLLTATLCSLMMLTASCSKKENEKESLSRNEMESVLETERAETSTSDQNEAEVDNRLSWKFDTEGKVVSSPIISGDVIYFGSNDGNFYAVNKDTGVEVWRYTLGFPILCQPTLQDDKVFFSGKDVFVAVDAKTGNELWLSNQQDKSDEIRRKDQWDYHDATPVIDNGVVYFGSFSGIVFGFDANTGDMVWEFDASKGNPVRTTPIIVDGIMYYGDWKGSYRAVDMEKKEILWQNEFIAPFQSATVIKDDVLLVGGRDTRVSAIDCTSGDIKWELKDSFGSWITGDPVIDGDTVYFSTSDAKKVYAINVKDGSVAAEYPIYKNSFTKVIIDNGRLYVTSGDAYSTPGTGKIQVYSLGDPSKTIEEFSLATGGIFTNPVINGNAIYFGSMDNSMYAVKLDSLQ